MRKISLLVLMVFFACHLCACSSDEAIASDFKQSGKIMGLSDISSDTYYVKDGASFTGLYAPPSELVTEANAYPAPASRYFMLFDEEIGNIPTLYGNECIIYRSQNRSPGGVTVERFKDAGKTLGAAEITRDDVGNIYLNESKLKQDSAISQAVSQMTPHSSVQIIGINGSGTIHTLLPGAIEPIEGAESFHVEFRLGTLYGAADIACDTHILESSEAFTAKTVSVPQKNYVRFTMPEDAEAGYYYIGSGGFVRYVPDRKVDEKSGYDMNRQNSFGGITASIDDFSEKDSVEIEKSLNAEVNQITFTITAPDGWTQISSVYVTAPDGKTHKANSGFGEHVCTINQPPKGTYIIRITGRNASYASVSMTYGDQ